MAALDDFGSRLWAWAAMHAGDVTKCDRQGWPAASQCCLSQKASYACIVQDPQVRPSLAQLLQHEFLRGVATRPETVRKALASLALRRHALAAQVGSLGSLVDVQQLHGLPPA